MVKKIKRKKSKAKKMSLRKKRKSGFRLPELKLLGVVFGLVFICAVVSIGFMFLADYVKKNWGVSERVGLIKLVDPPAWANAELKEKIYSAAMAYGEDLKLDDDAAISVHQNIETTVVWLDEIKVQTTDESFLVSAKWRKPIAMVKYGGDKFYADGELVILDYVSMPELPIVEVRGVSVWKRPLVGNLWGLEDLAAAVEILAMLEQRDKGIADDKGLLYHIAMIDISNFNGRENSAYPHIILYAKDGVEILWGAEAGKWQRHLEATDQEKLAMLYGYYQEHGSLLGGVKYIDLRQPQGKVSLPIDKY